MNTGIIRNRSKIEAAITNAGRFLAIQKEFGSFDAYIWSFVEGKPREHGFVSLAKIPAATNQVALFCHFAEFARIRSRSDR
jgi:DNA-3-methyladenine glycosylase I